MHNYAKVGQKSQIFQCMHVIYLWKGLFISFSLRAISVTLSINIYCFLGVHNYAEICQQSNISVTYCSYQRFVPAWCLLHSKLCLNMHTWQILQCEETCACYVQLERGLMQISIMIMERMLCKKLFRDRP